MWFVRQTPSDRTGKFVTASSYLGVLSSILLMLLLLVLFALQLLVKLKPFVEDSLNELFVAPVRLMTED